jgi:F0F1-type ATP synthase membrane subunit b/b'
MFHFNGTWLDLFYASFFVIGIAVVGLLFILVVWSVVLSRSVKADKDKERQSILDKLDPSKRAEHITELIKEAEVQTKALRAQQKKEAKNILREVKTDGDEKSSSGDEK